MAKKGDNQSISKKQSLGSLVKSGFERACLSLLNPKPLEMRKFRADPTPVVKA
jgi:hypothetical protein